MAQNAFSLQNVCKPFVFALVCDALGPDEAERLRGVDATGLPFNSVMDLELLEYDVGGGTPRRLPWRGAVAHARALARNAGPGLLVNADRMRANLEALQGLVFSERLARVVAREMDRASAQALVDDWSSLAVKERRHLRDVALAARPSLAAHIDDVFSLDALVKELAPVLDETLVGVPTDF